MEAAMHAVAAKPQAPEVTELVKIILDFWDPADEEGRARFRQEVGEVFPELEGSEGSGGPGPGTDADAIG
jgi:hypothetical protein